MTMTSDVLSSQIDPKQQHLVINPQMSRGSHLQRPQGASRIVTRDVPSSQTITSGDLLSNALGQAFESTAKESQVQGKSEQYLLDCPRAIRALFQSQGTENT